MCGIAGIFNFSGAPLAIPALRRMAHLLRHRGPDDEGFALFNTAHQHGAHYKGPDSPAGVTLPDISAADMSAAPNLGLLERRLAILDLSPAGHTPMVTRDGSLTIAFNGEIYNYLELRSELHALGHTFYTQGDTEVLLAAYRQWGLECVTRFNGMWAFALWDNAQQRLFCSRDRFGVKPFYYCYTREQFTFASEPKALWASGLCAPRVNEPLLMDFLAGYEASQPDQTLYAHIAQLPGGHNLIVTSASFTLARYWELPCNPALGPERLDETVVAQTRELLTDAVRLRLRSDVPVGTCLSGGLDSSAVVALINTLMQTEHHITHATVGAHQKTFTAAYDDAASDERAFAQQVVEQTGAEWHLAFPTAEGLRDDLDRFFWHHDEPPITTSMYAQWYVMRRVREQGVVVTLDGQGADELLGGYVPFDVHFAHLWRSGAWGRLAHEIRAAAHVGSRSVPEALLRAAVYQLPPALQRAAQRQRHQRLLGVPAVQAEAALQRHQIRSDTTTQNNLPRHLQALTLHNLPRLLRSEDRNAMAFSIEARTPFLDYRFAEHISQLPASYRLNAGWTKAVLRRALHGLLPESIVWRRDKKGFVTPERYWLRALHPRLVELFNDAARAAPYLDLPTVRATLSNTRYTQSAVASASVWRWAAAELWLRMLKMHSAGDPVHP